MIINHSSLGEGPGRVFWGVCFFRLTSPPSSATCWFVLLLRCSHLPVPVQPLFKVGPHGGAGESGFCPTSHCFTHLSDLWEVRVIPLTHQNISSHQRMDTEQWWDIMGAPQARSTEFSDFSRSPAYCPSCTGGRLEVSKLFHKTTRFRSPYSLSLNGHCTLNFFLPILIP